MNDVKEPRWKIKNVFTKNTSRMASTCKARIDELRTEIEKWALALKQLQEADELVNKFKSIEDMKEAVKLSETHLNQISNKEEDNFKYLAPQYLIWAMQKYLEFIKDNGKK